MARSVDENSGSSEFFIIYDDAPGLDGKYAAFGKVIEGMETVDKFLEVERFKGFPRDTVATTPIEPIIIKKAILLENEDGENPIVQMEIEY